MALVNVTDISIPEDEITGPFTNDFSFVITFECVGDLEEGECARVGRSSAVGAGMLRPGPPIAAGPDRYCRRFKSAEPHPRVVRTLGPTDTDRRFIVTYWVCWWPGWARNSCFLCPAASPAPGPRRARVGASLCADLEWRVIYVGSAESEKFDQELDNVLVGPIPTGYNKFVLSVSRPAPFCARC